jgi:hypothetical protein
MSTLPDKREDFLTWCQAHAPVWEQSPSKIGLTPSQATAFTAATTTALTALLNQEKAKQAALSATDTAQDRIGELRSTAGEFLRTIRAFAAATNNEQVFVDAQIPPTSAPTPVGPPGTPENFKIELNNQGAVTLKFKCTNPSNASGTSYIVRRKLAGQAAFSFVGVTGKKSFTDTTISGTVTQIEYTVQAQRSDVSGPVSQTVTVRFGGGGAGGGQIVSVSEGGDESGSIKLAA